MTKARDLANIISGGFTVADLPTLTASEIPNLDASKITTGSIADARIPASAVSQHATSFDDNKIVNDISTLAIRQASNENKGAYNTNSMYVDVFQDDTGIGTETNTDRNSNEYVSSIVQTVKSFYKPNNDQWDFTNSSSGVSNNAPMTFMFVGKSANGSDWLYNGSQGGGVINLPTNNGNKISLNIGYGSNNGKFGVHTSGISDCNTASAITAPVNDWIWFMVRTGSSWGTGSTDIYWRARTDTSWTNPTDANGGTTNEGIAGSGSAQLFRNLSTGYTTAFDNTHTAHIGFWNRELNNTEINEIFNNGQIFDWSSASSNSNLQEYFKFDDGSGTTITNYGNGGNATKQSGSGAWDSDNTQLGSLTANATGNFISNVITAPSSTSKMGAIITYQDNAGTNTLNTDIVLQLSADNGSNFTTATLTAMPDFASGIKMAKVNDLSVTAGTQLKYKISFANQSGSKEARIRGVSLQY
jgi:hypothetical protein